MKRFPAIFTKSRRCLRPAQIASQFVLLAAVTLITSCVAPSAPTDPSTHPQAVVFPLFDMRTDKSIKIECTPPRPISSKFLGSRIQCIIHQAADEGLQANFTGHDLETA